MSFFVSESLKDIITEEDLLDIQNKEYLNITLKINNNHFENVNLESRKAKNETETQ